MKQMAIEVLVELKQALRELAAAVVSREGLILLFATVIFATRYSLYRADWLPGVLDQLYQYGHHRQVRLRVTSILCFGLLPFVLAIVVHRQSPFEHFGLRLPEKRWVYFTLSISALHLLTIPLWAELSFMQEYYPMFRPARQGGVVFWQWSILMLLAMVSWEFVVRGYLMLGLKPRLGVLAVLVQNVPFVILHFGKPTEELMFSILAGLGLGLLAYVANSIWPAVFLHGAGAFVMDFYLVYCKD